MVWPHRNPLDLTDDRPDRSTPMQNDKHADISRHVLGASR
jgi:hypothetical protein